MSRVEPAADFDVWVGPHLPAMAALAARLSGQADRDDVVQEALVDAWRRWSTYDERRGTPRVWLLAITARRAYRQARRRRPDGVPASESVTFPDTVAADLDLRRAVSVLPRRQRLAVELHYYVGLGVAECAGVMGCAEGTVKSTLADARARLRAELGENR